MARNEIVYKLNAFLARPNPFAEERDVVYFLVELRKLIEQQRPASVHPVVKFYADWALHPRKDHPPTGEMKRAATALHSAAATHLSAANSSYTPLDVSEFTRMKSLAIALKALLNAEGIDDRFIGDGKSWTQFVMVLARVLADQPIVNPIAAVAEIRFDTSAAECVITFSAPVGGKTEYRYKAW